jgi:hypothetical protein
MRQTIQYLPEPGTDYLFHEYVRELIETGTYDLYKRNIERWEQWFHAMEVE